MFFLWSFYSQGSFPEITGVLLFYSLFKIGYVFEKKYQNEHALLKSTTEGFMDEAYPLS